MFTLKLERHVVYGGSPWLFPGPCGEDADIQDLAFKHLLPNEEDRLFCSDLSLEYLKILADLHGWGIEVTDEDLGMED